MDPLFAAGLKVASSKEGEGGVKDGRLRDARSSGGDFFLSLLRGEGSQEEVPWALVIDASLEKRYVHVKNLLLQPCCFRLPLSFHVFHQA